MLVGSKEERQVVWHCIDGIDGQTHDEQWLNVGLGELMAVPSELEWVTVSPSELRWTVLAPSELNSLIRWCGERRRGFCGVFLVSEIDKLLEIPCLDVSS